MLRKIWGYPQNPRTPIPPALYIRTKIMKRLRFQIFINHNKNNTWFYLWFNLNNSNFDRNAMLFGLAIWRCTPGFPRPCTYGPKIMMWWKSKALRRLLEKHHHELHEHANKIKKKPLLTRIMTNFFLAS